jgi:hypothetical protein
MHSITVIIGSLAFALIFKTKESAAKACTTLGERIGEYLVIEDDYGQKIDARFDMIAGFIFEDMEKSKLAHVERALHQQRTQNLAQKTAETDPSLRMARNMNGPAIVSPFPRN